MHDQPEREAQPRTGSVDLQKLETPIMIVWSMLGLLLIVLISLALSA